MDTTTVRTQLKEVTDQLTNIEREREILLTLKRGLEGWLDLYPGKTGPAVTQPTLALLPPKKAAGQSSARTGKPTGKPVGTVALRSVVPLILQEAHGAPMHADEILQRARARGADSAAIDPAGVIELMLYTARKRRGLPLERVGPRTWRWAGS